MPVHVRRLQTSTANVDTLPPEWAEALGVLIRRCFRGCTLDPSFRRTGGVWWWVAEDENGKPVGFAGLRPGAAGKAWHFHLAGVLPGHRRQGVARRLSSARIRFARSYGATQIRSYTWVGNVASANNLIRRGFVAERGQTAPYLGFRLDLDRRR